MCPANRASGYDRAEGRAVERVPGRPDAGSPIDPRDVGVGADDAESVQGDTLFTFLMHELADAEDRDHAIAMLEIAICDIQNVLDVVVDQADDPAPINEAALID